MAWTIPGGTIAPGVTQEFTFTFSGGADVGPQFIQARPTSNNALLYTNTFGEATGAAGQLSYRATLRNGGATVASYIWRGGGVT
ncbi:hypothetical protein [Streptomyces sp. NPDC003077]|uniref:hypothetical protein n=1 Tax=Streptomyces sp. NPDC003077 TaxID=3154443 RepID=UPI0033A14F7D